MTASPRGLRYVELGSSNLDRSRDFYSGLLGFEELDVGAGGRTSDHSCWFAAGPALLKVVAVGPRGAPGSWVDEDLQGGMRHVGFKVGDVDEQVGRLEAAGIEVLSPPRDVLGEVRIAFFLDPDGARLEYVQGNLRYEHVESRPLVQAEVERGLAPGDGPRFDHVGLTVADLGAALDFWCGRLGYQVIGDIRHHGDERGFLMTYLQAGDSVLEVFSFDVPTSPPPATSPERLGLRGLGLGADGVRLGDAPLDPGGVPISWVDADE